MRIVYLLTGAMLVWSVLALWLTPVVAFAPGLLGVSGSGLIMRSRNLGLGRVLLVAFIVCCACSFGAIMLGA